ncbi:hypothetical protein M427DRAFT_140699 [Gonapodya prolifera JEL478]|uniref:Uncharacterized protein n=1 Tax=Gonapodya prolifera (strain JEL478) TaxID=1344416 RepID=A0A138ZYG5_GONPJ|nr:hypothetical protein M427DRAFT_140699 [Gonapodya prolifera JEL478]|eukprot:KXS09548.1 hypothetical protein M427DRAFT_140699 [Gonapodya prolifera JEL478]
MTECFDVTATFTAQTTFLLLAGLVHAEGLFLTYPRDGPPSHTAPLGGDDFGLVELTVGIAPELKYVKEWVQTEGSV